MRRQAAGNGCLRRCSRLRSLIARLMFVEYGCRSQRAVYSYDDRIPALITVYYPFAQRYFGGGGSYADKILT